MKKMSNDVIDKKHYRNRNADDIQAEVYKRLPMIIFSEMRKIWIISFCG